MNSEPVEIFFSYAREDEHIMNDVRRQFVIYERKGWIIKWYDRQIFPGQNWNNQIDEHLHKAQIILLFISPYFIESDYCYNLEMVTALDRHSTGKAVTIPIILHPCPWKESPLKYLQALPTDGKAVALWSNREEVCLSVAEAVMDEVKKLRDVGKNVLFNTPQVTESRIQKNNSKKNFLLKGTIFLLLACAIALLVYINLSKKSVTLLRDPRDGQSYPTSVIDSLEWMNSNLNFKLTEFSWCHENDKSNCKKYGRLYNWLGAQQACPGLGSGWRLPTSHELETMVPIVKQNLEDQEVSGLLGGEANPPNDFLYLGEIGILWSGNKNTAGFVWILYIDGRSNNVDVVDIGSETYAYSCRCVRKTTLE